MLTLYITDVNGFSVSLESWDNFVDALLAFDLCRFDFTVGHISLVEEYSDLPSVVIKEHTTLWAQEIDAEHAQKTYCDYCNEDGRIETDNNGPIDVCPICSGNKELTRG